MTCARVFRRPRQLEEPTVDVNDRVEALRRESADRIRAMPDKREESNLHIAGKTATVITWHDEPSPGFHRVVVAAYHSAMLGMAKRVTAAGFMLNPDGSSRQLTEEELQPFQ
jgi:hypothetical protein